MASQLPMNPQMEQIHGEIWDTFRVLAADSLLKSEKMKTLNNVVMSDDAFNNVNKFISCGNCISRGDGFQKLDKIRDSNRQSKQLEELTGKMRECKRLIIEFDREIKDEEGRNSDEVNKQLNDEKQSMGNSCFVRKRKEMAGEASSWADQWGPGWYGAADDEYSRMGEVGHNRKNKSKPAFEKAKAAASAGARRSSWGHPAASSGSRINVRRKVLPNK